MSGKHNRVIAVIGINIGKNASGWYGSQSFFRYFLSDRFTLLCPLGGGAAASICRPGSTARRSASTAAGFVRRGDEGMFRWFF